MSEATKRVRRRGEAGNALVLCALLLPVLLGFCALAIDVGYLYYVRTAMQATADAACFAGGSGLPVSQDEATKRANESADQNINQTVVLANSALAVSFPSDADLNIRTTVSNPTVPLFFARVLGWATAPVSATALCGAAPASYVPNGLVPLGIYCNRPDGCESEPKKLLEQFQKGKAWPLTRRYCGNFFIRGNKDACGNSVAPNENFLIGLALGEAASCNKWGEGTMSNAEFRSNVYHGVDGYVGTVACALPGNRNGWRDGMEDRLLEGRNKMIFPVIKQSGEKPRAVEIIAFVGVEVSYFGSGSPDQTTFEITEVSFSLGELNPPPNDYGLNSVTAVALLE